MNRIWGILTGLIVFAGWLSAGEAVLAQPKQKISPEQVEFFEKKIRPVLADHCFSCHGSEKQRGNLRVDGLAYLLAGNGHGPILVPGQPEKSKLIQVLQYTGEIKMPQKGKLPQPVLDDIAAWVKIGAPWPGDKGTIAKKDASHGKDHWAFQPVKKPGLPKVKQADWVKSPIDAFILGKLESKGLTPANAADKRTLIRRAYYDLIGLPPTAEEIEAFVADDSPDSFAKVVDKLLASPHYGERWGRHWLDVARYADTKGYVFLEERRYPYSYTYRDYVIQAFNQDKPYNQFILEQVAADQLVAKKQADKKSLAAMGFLTLGRRFLNNKHDIIDDRIDVVSRGLLGLTVSCARCHDHKYDPIPSKDYYSLYGVFASSYEPKELPLIMEPGESEAYKTFEQGLQKLVKAAEEFREKNKAELAKKNRKVRDQLKALERKVEQYKVSAPGSPPRAMVLYDAEQMFNPSVFPRGKPGGGPQVPRQFLEILSGPKRQPFQHGSGRLELAQAIASADNPLTARVLVNRVWLHHFGKGLVATASDFGVRCEPPTHPELLDYLAAQFVEDGWSIKKLHRLTMLSAVYQQSSQTRPECAKIDPENSLLHRMNRQRLDFEAMRDSILLVSGNLDKTMGGKSVDITQAPFPKRRTVYAFIERQNLPGIFRTFDFASPDSSSPGRFQTTVPQQALFLMNSPFLIEQVKSLMKSPALAGEMSDTARIQKLYRQIFGRAPTPQEVALGTAFVKNGQTAQGLNVWERYAQVLLLTNEFMFVD